MPSKKHLSERCRKDSNYRTVRLGISKILKKIVVKYVPPYTKGSFKIVYFSFYL